MNTEAPTEDGRLPKEHGHSVAEVVDMGGPVARIERRTYVNAQWTTLTIMVPIDVDQPAQSVHVQLTREQLNKFVERLAWPTK